MIVDLPCLRTTLCNVCSVHWGMFSTSGGVCVMCVQYIGGCSVHRGCLCNVCSVHWGVFSTSGGVCVMCIQYIGGCSVHRGVFV